MPIVGYLITTKRMIEFFYSVSLVIPTKDLLLFIDKYPRVFSWRLPSPCAGGHDPEGMVNPGHSPIALITRDNRSGSFI